MEANFHNHGLKIMKNTVTQIFPFFNNGNKKMFTWILHEWGAGNKTKMDILVKND